MDEVDVNQVLRFTLVETMIVNVRVLVTRNDVRQVVFDDGCHVTMDFACALGCQTGKVATD